MSAIFLTDVAQAPSPVQVYDLMGRTFDFWLAPARHRAEPILHPRGKMCVSRNNIFLARGFRMVLLKEEHF